MRAACAQLDAKTMNAAREVWPVVDRLAEQAAAARVDLLVYPEIAYPSYVLESRDRYFRGDIERSAAVLARFSKLASFHRLWLVAGFVEEAGDRLFNSASVFDRSGELRGLARKQFMWDCDRIWFSPGHECTVLDTEFGRAGLQVCADLRLPEISATLAARGATFMLQPTAWVNASAVRRTYRNVQPDFLVAARAIEFGLPFVCCSKSGRDGSAMEYVGQSRIVGPDGKTIATAAIGGDELVVAEFEPAPARLTPIEKSTHERLQSESPPFTCEPTHLKCTLPIRRSAAEIVEQLERQGVRVATMSAEQLKSFAPTRCAALDGKQVIVADGPRSSDIMPRARAAENRVFVICAGLESVYLVVDPAGIILGRSMDLSAQLELNIGLADRKVFTPTTDIWSQRRPASYQFA